MKKFKFITCLTLLVATTITFAQKDFKWDVKSDSLQANKSQLYSKTKLYIGETWKSAQDVIQSDDKDGGVILVKGLSIQNLNYQMNDHRWTYSYTIKFMVKDNKSRIIIDDVRCTGARVGTYEWAHMPVADQYPAAKGMKLTGVNEKRYLTLITNLKAELQAIADSYMAAVAETLGTEDSDW